MIDDIRSRAQALVIHSKCWDVDAVEAFWRECAEVWEASANEHKKENADLKKDIAILNARVDLAAMTKERKSCAKCDRENSRPQDWEAESHGFGG